MRQIGTQNLAEVLCRAVAPIHRHIGRCGDAPQVKPHDNFDVARTGRTRSDTIGTGTGWGVGGIGLGVVDITVGC